MLDDCNAPRSAQLGLDDESASSLALRRLSIVILDHYWALELEESIA